MNHVVRNARVAVKTSNITVAVGIGRIKRRTTIVANPGVTVGVRLIDRVIL